MNTPKELYRKGFKSELGNPFYATQFRAMRIRIIDLQDYILDNPNLPTIPYLMGILDALHENLILKLASKSAQKSIDSDVKFYHLGRFNNG